MEHFYCKNCHANQSGYSSLSSLMGPDSPTVAQMEEFTPEAVAKVSKACTSICMWVRAMYVYHNVALQVKASA